MTCVVFVRPSNVEGMVARSLLHHESHEQFSKLSPERRARTCPIKTFPRRKLRQFLHVSVTLTLHGRWWHPRVLLVVSSTARLCFEKARLKHAGPAPQKPHTVSNSSVFHEEQMLNGS
jgi:hypothetical protein